MSCGFVQDIEFVCCTLSISGPGLHILGVGTGKQEEGAQAYTQLEDHIHCNPFTSLVLIFQSLYNKVKYKYLCKYKYMHKYWHDVD